MKIRTKKFNGFMLVEAMICLAVISIFLTYFFVYTNFIYKNDFIKKEREEAFNLAKEIIEKSSSLGKLCAIDNDKYVINAEKITETTRRIDYKLTIKDIKNNRVNEYEFSIDKRKRS